MKFFKMMVLAVIAACFAGCGGGGGNSTSGASAPKNTGGGYTIVASGGTFNTGAASKGLALLVTLRDSSGNGPGLNGGWQISLTGPGITQPLQVNYDDGSPSSYQIWRWQDITPSSGTYTATATNGTATISYQFTIDAAAGLPRPLPSKSGSTISWSPIAGVGSYYFKLSDGTGRTVDSGYLAGTTAFPSFQLPTLADGSYLVEVYVYRQNFPALMTDSSAAPPLVSQADCSLAGLDLALAGGAAGSYDLASAGGTLYLGKDNAGADRYGLAVWTSILTSTGTAPASDWSITVTGPGIATPIVFTYPKTGSHYLYWDFGTTPLSGTYTITAASPGYSLTSAFAIPNPAAQLPVAANIAVTTASSSYGISWSGVSGAASYYVNIWTPINGVYTEVQGVWVNGSTYTVSLPRNSLTKGQLYDIYVTASSLDMTTVGTVPPPNPTQVNMSDNTYGAVSFTAQ